MTNVSLVKTRTTERVGVALAARRRALRHADRYMRKGDPEGLAMHFRALSGR